MTAPFAFLLGLLQGLTEFLPVSSSGHLAAARLLHGMREPELAFDIALHVATLAAIFVYFRRPLRALALSLAGRALPGEPPPRDQHYLLLLIALTLLPTGFIYLLFRHQLEAAGTRGTTLAVAFSVTAALLLATRFRIHNPPRATAWRDLSPASAILIGLAQGAALTPGISRAGATVAVALLLGLDRDLAVRFSFLIAIPAIAAAALIPLSRGFDGVPPAALAAGMAGAFLVGLGSIHLLRWVVLARRLHWFALYVLAVAALLLIAAP